MSKSLIIVDEIGGGTDPKEGESLAMAIIEHRVGDVVTVHVDDPYEVKILGTAYTNVTFLIGFIVIL